MGVEQACHLCLCAADVGFELLQPGLQLLQLLLRLAVLFIQAGELGLGSIQLAAGLRQFAVYRFLFVAGLADLLLCRRNGFLHVF